MENRLNSLPKIPYLVPFFPGLYFDASFSSYYQYLMQDGSKRAVEIWEAERSYLTYSNMAGPGKCIEFEFFLYKSPLWSHMILPVWGTSLA